MHLCRDGREPGGDADAPSRLCPAGQQAGPPCVAGATSSCILAQAQATLEAARRHLHVVRQVAGLPGIPEPPRGVHDGRHGSALRFGARVVGGTASEGGRRCLRQPTAAERRAGGGHHHHRQSVPGHRQALPARLTSSLQVMVVAVLRVRRSADHIGALKALMRRAAWLITPANHCRAGQMLHLAVCPAAWQPMAAHTASYPLFPELTFPATPAAGLCPDMLNASRTLGSKSALCQQPQPLGRLVIGEYGCLTTRMSGLAVDGRRPVVCMRSSLLEASFMPTHARQFRETCGSTLDPHIATPT